MARSLDRRAFLEAGAVGSLAGLAAALPLKAAAQAPVIKRSGPKPVVISSANGNRFTNGGALTCVAQAFALMEKGGDLLDALIAGVNIVELDPTDDSVG